MTAQIKNYYAAANSSLGFVDYFRSNLEELERLYILKGGPGTGKSTLMKKIGAYFFEEGYDIEFIHCSSDNQSLDGVIIPQLKVGIVDGTSPHVIEPKAPGAIEEYVNLGVAWDSNLLIPHREVILKTNQLIAKNYQKAYEKFREARNVHDDWEKYYIKHIEYEKASRLTQEVLSEYLNYPVISNTPTVKHRFFGATTPEGPIDVLPNLIDPLKKRYFIKGRPGTGKSTLMKRIAKKAQDLGYNVEIYHCSFDPDSLDMVLIPQLSLCFFDSTAPHEYFPSRESDEVIDTYQAFIMPHVDELYASELAGLSLRYRQHITRGTGYLKQAKLLHDELETYYKEAVDFEIINQLYDNILTEIKALIK